MFVTVYYSNQDNGPVIKTERGMFILNAQNFQDAIIESRIDRKKEILFQQEIEKDPESKEITFLTEIFILVDPIKEKCWGIKLYLKSDITEKTYHVHIPQKFI